MDAQTKRGGVGVSTESRGQSRARSTVRSGDTLMKGKNQNASVQGGKEEGG